VGCEWRLRRQFATTYYYCEGYTHVHECVMMSSTGDCMCWSVHTVVFDDVAWEG